MYNVGWRLELPIASRRHNRSGAALHSDGAASSPAEEAAAVKYTIQLDTEADDGSVKTRWLTCDFETLVNITKSVEDAVNAMRSPEYRRLHKMVK